MKRRQVIDIANSVLRHVKHYCPKVTHSVECRCIVCQATSSTTSTSLSRSTKGLHVARGRYVDYKIAVLCYKATTTTTSFLTC